MSLDAIPRGQRALITWLNILGVVPIDKRQALNDNQHAKTNIQ